MAVTKDDIVARIHEVGFTKKQSVDLVETLIEIIKGNLEKSEDVLVSGFGKFCVKTKESAARPQPCDRGGSDAAAAACDHLQVLRKTPQQDQRPPGIRSGDTPSARRAIPQRRSRTQPRPRAFPCPPASQRYAVGFDLAQQRGVADLQQTRGLRAIAAGFLQGLGDQFFLDDALSLLQRKADRGTSPRFRCLPAQIQAAGRCSGISMESSASSTRPFDDVFELAHVARPAVFQQAPHGGRADDRDVLAQLAVEAFQKMLAQVGDVFRPLAQRRQGDGENVQPVVEILAERPCRTSSSRCFPVAAITRTSTRVALASPTGRTSLS